MTSEDSKTNTDPVRRIQSHVGWSNFILYDLLKMVKLRCGRVEIGVGVLNNVLQLSSPREQVGRVNFGDQKEFGKENVCLTKCRFLN